MRLPERTAVVVSALAKHPQEHGGDEWDVAGEYERSAGPRVLQGGDDAREGMARLVRLRDDLGLERRQRRCSAFATTTAVTPAWARAWRG